MVTIEELKKLELITAKILDVQDHPNADRLYVLNIDTGTEEKQLVAGIRKSYTKEELIGRTIIVINNLQPAVIRGQDSNGMLLAVGDEKGISLICTDREVPVGSAVS